MSHNEILNGMNITKKRIEVLWNLLQQNMRMDETATLHYTNALCSISITHWIDRNLIPKWIIQINPHTRPVFLLHLTKYTRQSKLRSTKRFGVGRYTSMYYYFWWKWKPAMATVTSSSSSSIWSVSYTTLMRTNFVEVCGPLVIF